MAPKRDDFTRKTPPKGVQAQIAGEFHTDDDATPVEGGPLAMIAHRLTQLDHNHKSLANDVVVMFNQDRAAHDKLSAENKELDDGLKVVNSHVGNLREVTAKMSGKLDVVLEQARADRNIAASRIQAELDKEVALIKSKLRDDNSAADEKRKRNRTIFSAVIKVIAHIVTLGAGAALAATSINGC